METKKSTRRITKHDLLCLLDKKHSSVLEKLNKSEFGFVLYLENRRYDEEENSGQILEIIVEILSRVCSMRSEYYRARLDRLLRMLISCQQFLFDDVPRLLYSCVANVRDINLVTFMVNYMSILKTLLCHSFFPSDRIVTEIFPALENYINRLRERRIANLDTAEDWFVRLKREVDRLEESPDTDDEEEDLGGNFRDLSIVPRSNDIVNCEMSNIPQNIIDRPYKSVDHFLSVHYRLTREDMLRAFRECVRMCISPNIRTMGENKQYKVSVSCPPRYTTDGIVYSIKAVTSNVNGFGDRALIPGTLVFLSHNDFNSVVFATVKSNPNTDYGKSKEAKLKIKLEDDRFSDELFKDLEYTMVEPKAYFECYKHVLSAIKEFSEASFPLSDIIAYLETTDPEPSYLEELEHYCVHEKCDDSIDYDEPCSCKTFNPLKDDEWPTSKDLKLDEMQYKAFKIALTKKVAVIQGPPGTGKTFIGVKVVKALLRNVPYRPIVICCLTNHALDQFLERILTYTKKVVRLGSQSKSEELEPHKLENMKYAISQYRRGDIVNEMLSKSLNLVKKLASTVLHQKMPVEHEEQYFAIDALSKSINQNLDTYSRCLDKYLDDDALNKIIHPECKNQLRRVAGAVPKSLSAGVLEWLMCSRTTDLYEKCSKKFQQFKNRRDLDYPLHIEDIWTLTGTKRYELFYSWRRNCLDKYKKILDDEIKLYKSRMIGFKDKPSDPAKLEIIKGANVIGVTTTGACKFRDLIRFAQPRIMLVEEAAQVLESHVIASLVPTIQHLILIGDHEQLRPLPADHDLSETYNLKISMFERLFRNEAPSATLILQHRMKPCIAELLVPQPYEEYESFENVYKYEEINGFESSVFFFDHRHFEDQNSSGISSSNDFEAQMIASLAKYLRFNLYSSNQITILATYAAQVLLIHKRLEEQKLDDIYVTTVDNFQGEENDIILLSFVRSNNAVIGFLKESNRVCVALSRARKGMFCFGNFQLFAEKNTLWSGIVGKLRAKNMIGETLPLKCFRHQIINPVQSSEDISAFISNGCSEDCNFALPCSHKCTRKCHFLDPDHLYYSCKQPCERMIDETRVCPRLCFERCKKAKKTYIELPCGHLSSRRDSKCCEEVTVRLPCTHVVTVPCHVDVQQYQCKAVVNIKLDCGHKKGILCYEQKLKRNIVCTDLRQQIGPCGHTIDVPCSIHLKENDILSLCNKACGDLLNCRHPCVGLCRVCLDTGIHKFCSENCELILPCGHKCGGYCGSPCPPCKRKCFLSCGHRTSCINDCLRPCIKCDKPCERVCMHNRCTAKCWEDCDVDPCTEPCIKKLPCGHRCIGLCGDPCPYLCRECHADCLKHGNDENSRYVQLECEHVIEVNEMNERVNDSLLSFEWPYCPQCSKPITQSVRYKNKLKRAKNTCVDSCDMSEDISKVLYLVESMYGREYIVPAAFIPVHNKILRILKRNNPESHTLMVLRNCVIVLKKLHIISSEFDVPNSDAYIQGKFDTLMLWIYNHLTNASFQQLKELETAVKQLRQDISCTTRLRVNDD